ncbi:taxis cluster protein CheC [Natronomonas pharaonis DSM 2160]|uniref:Taxis cluster protein CheC n=1 Tax=Natronomonas pharaonis (strain ATCC 35678 / DSM 2160 / CIP 103997 / JCM 8858 / NBRC 14720 / NCIMB 2260 / Gabara) TaxID=348780 RepID=A0A1U7EX09_NATPD|nr:chemotaxis protein CheC [Natronomonas pharaonis]CAI49650.1 taxis cluster protein CheC [Natronomonas pharaonis DSM 2160]
MRIAINQLEEYNYLASRGAKQAARALSQMTGIKMRHEVTGVSLVSDEALADIFTGQKYVGVQVGLSGGIAGETVLIFDPNSAGRLRKRLQSRGGESTLAGGAFAELGNIMIGGFIDGWADHLGTEVDMTPPTYIEAAGTRILPPITRRDAEEYGVFLFESRLQAVNHDLSVPIYLIPEYSEFVKLLRAQPSGLAVPAEKLTVFNGFADQSARRASQQISQLTGLRTDVTVSQLRFISFSDISSEVGTNEYVSVVFELTGRPSGYFVVMFSEDSASRVASAMLPGGVDPDNGGMMQEAIKELGNIVTSGFIDGWANTLQSSIEHSPPEYIEDSGSNIIETVQRRLSDQQEYAFTIDTTITIDNRQAEVQLYVLPDTRELAEALSALPVQE